MQIGKSTIPDRVSDPALAEVNGAAAATGQGAGFDRLVAAAQAEANRRQAIAARSGASADAFTDQAWFDAIKRHGTTIGLGVYANAIKSDGRGQLVVSDSAMRQKILAARNDPNVRAMMAVKRAGDSRTALTKELGRAPSEQEMRAAEVVGATSAAKLILTRQGTPLSSAAIAAPDAAEANRALFYRQDGSPFTVNEVLQRIMTPAQAVSGPVSAPVLAPSAVTQGQPLPAEVMRAMQGQANFASAGAQNPVVTQPRRVAPPPDLALVGGTIGNLSMPGMTKGAAGATGGQLGGWRGQMSNEVMTQITQPQRNVQNLPSNVTIPAPQPTRYMASNEVHRQAVPTAVTPPAASPVTSLGPNLAGQQTGTTPPAAPLPSLIVDGQSRATPALPGDALALLPVGQQPPGVPAQSNGTPQTLAPLQGQGSATGLTTETSQPQAAAVPQVEAAPERPSRYGPRTRQEPQPERTASVLNYATSGDAQGDSPAAAAAGIRPSRYYNSPASAAAQQYAAMSRMATAPQSQPQVASPADVDGNSLLPPVPGLNGLPPLTAAEALRAGPVQVAPAQSGPVPPRPIGQTEAERLALLEGNKPLDLSPDAPVYAAAEVPVIVSSQPPQQQANRMKPRTMPPFMFGR